MRGGGGGPLPVVMEVVEEAHDAPSAHGRGRGNARARHECRPPRRGPRTIHELAIFFAYFSYLFSNRFF